MLPSVSRRAAAVADDLGDRGFTLDKEGWATIARGGSERLAGIDAPLAVTSLTDSRPLTAVSAIANAAHEGQVPVLVADQRTAREVKPLLSDPFLLEGQGDGRKFVTIEDRIRLSDDGYACVGTDGRIEWFESPDGATDSPPLVLSVGDDRVTTLDSVDGLACPGPSVSAFPYSYARGEDGRFRVFERGQAVGQYTGVGAMRANGFRPVPLPLVPEHHVRTHGRLARATLLVTVDGDRTVSYRSFRA